MEISGDSEGAKMDSSQKEEGLSSEGLPEVEIKKCCSDCKTTKTPLWRSGPSGPKSLCNACGIRYRKKRPTPVAATGKSDVKKGKFEKSRNVKLRNALKVNLMTFGREMDEEEEEGEEEGKRSLLKKQRSGRQWGEVERAALLLMALSCGAVFA